MPAEKVLIVIHGMGRLGWSMAHLGPIGTRYGYNKVLNFTYKARTQTIKGHAEELARFIQAHDCEGKTIHFVTHSLGSIIVRYYIDSFAEGTRPPYIRIVMLGPPNNGSIVAKKFQHFKLLQARFGSPLAELAAGSFPALPSDVEVGIIAGVISTTRSLHPWYQEPNDLLVSVSETKLEGSTDHRIIRCPHAVLMYAPNVIRQTFYFLTHGSFA